MICRFQKTLKNTTCFVTEQHECYMQHGYRKGIFKSDTPFYCHQDSNIPEQNESKEKVEGVLLKFFFPHFGKSQKVGGLKKRKMNIKVFMKIFFLLLKSL